MLNKLGQPKILFVQNKTSWRRSKKVLLYYAQFEGQVALTWWIKQEVSLQYGYTSSFHVQEERKLSRIMMKLIRCYFSFVSIYLALCTENNFRNVFYGYFNETVFPIENETISFSPSESPVEISTSSPTAILVNILDPPPPVPSHPIDWFAWRGLSKETFAMATGLVFLALLGGICFIIFFADLIRIFRGKQQQHQQSSAVASLSPLFAVGTTPEENKRYSMVGSQHVEMHRRGKFEDEEEIQHIHPTDSEEDRALGGAGHWRLLGEIPSSSSPPGRARSQSWAAFR